MAVFDPSKMFPPPPRLAAQRKRLELADGTWLTVAQVGGSVTDAHAALFVETVERPGFIHWSQIAVGKPVTVLRNHQPPLKLGVLENAWVIT